MKRTLRHLLPAPWRAWLRERFGEYFYSARSYSQEGEDLVLRRLFERQPTGIYVDVGAHHPFRFSNTCLLHKQGWRGINIDARPGSMGLFERFRPGDINLEIGVSRESKEMEYFLFEESALNTFNAPLANQWQKQGWRLVTTAKVQCLPLRQILERELPRLGAESIDVLTVDAEGFDLEVLQSNDWARYPPRVLIVEILGTDLAQASTSEIGRYCSSLGYELFAKLHQSVFFQRR